VSKGWMKAEVSRLQAHPCLVDCTANTIHIHKNKMTVQWKKKTPLPPPRLQQQQQANIITLDVPPTLAGTLQLHALLFSPIDPINHGARPLLGATEDATQESEKNCNDAVTHWAEQLAASIEKSKNEGQSYLGKGVLAEMICKARTKFSMRDSVKISENAIRTTVKPGKLDWQIKPPMDPMEPTLVSVCVLWA